jgi:very-short-patch-repair endonuclease
MGIIVGQRVPAEKRQRARELRAQMTSAERILWEALRGGRLDGLRFRRQQVIDGFIADFYCHAARLVIEVDGSVHDAQRGYDEARDQLLSGLGLRIIRIANDDVEKHLERVLRQISVAVKPNLEPA